MYQPVASEIQPFRQKVPDSVSEPVISDHAGRSFPLRNAPRPDDAFLARAGPASSPSVECHVHERAMGVFRGVNRPIEGDTDLFFAVGKRHL